MSRKKDIQDAERPERFRHDNGRVSKTWPYMPNIQTSALKSKRRRRENEGCYDALVYGQDGNLHIRYPGLSHKAALEKCQFWQKRGFRAWVNKTRGGDNMGRKAFLNPDPES